jgi:LCP family protein required for cell wall assembly
VRIKRSLPVAVPGLALAVTAGVLGTAALPERQGPRAMNILLMGIDRRDTITAEERREFHAGGDACNCTDTLMLVHLSARRDRVSVVSLPRDSLAEIPAHRDPATGEDHPPLLAKINDAYGRGGPELTVATVESMTGVEVDSYLQLDFRRFIDAVDQVGGVEVCTARPPRDSSTELGPPPGKHRLGGGRALEYVRSPKTDSVADLGRVQRQQRFLVAALRKLRAGKLLTDPRGMGVLVRTLMGQVAQGIKVSEMLELAAALQDVPARATEFATVPIGGFNPDFEGIGPTLKWEPAKADQMFTKLRNDQPLVEAGTDPRPEDPPGFTPASPVRGSALACP